MLFRGLSSIKKPILVTGHTGFKGTWLHLLLESLGLPHSGYSLPPQNDSLREKLSDFASETSMYGDIRNFELLRESIEKINPAVIIHLAAQPLVLDSYKRPLETFQTNIQGTANLLEAAVKSPSVKVILVITTDKVYLNSDGRKGFREFDSLGGSDPYSASKVGAEWVARSYENISRKSNGPRILTARAGNVIGGGDLSEDRLFPDIIRAIQANSPLVIRNPNATRPWQHVLDPLIGYLTFIDHHLLGSNVPSVLNFGPLGESMKVREVLSIVNATLKEQLNMISNVEDSGLETHSLQLDSSLATSELGWKQLYTQIEAIKLTMDWWQKVLIEKMPPHSACRDDIEYAIEKLSIRESRK